MGGSPDQADDLWYVAKSLENAAGGLGCPQCAPRATG
jgi:hypothetical protein